jgi:putative MFS transporter
MRDNDSIVTPTAGVPPENETWESRVSDLNGRMDRIPVWAHSRWVFIALGLSCFVVYYDVNVIGYTLPVMLPDLGLPVTASGPPITANVIGYMIGSYLLASLADYIGRRRAFAVSILLLAIGALLTAFSWDLASLTVFRGLTGFGIGGQIAILATIVGELSNATSRGRFLALCTAFGSTSFVVGPFLGIALLPAPRVGWRVLFGFGVVIIAVLFWCRDRYIPESPRWLILHGREDRAERIVAQMEQTARRRYGGELPAVRPMPAERKSSGFPTMQLFSRELLARMSIIVVYWLAFYFTVFGFLGYYPTILGKLGSSENDVLMYTGVGSVGFLVGAFVTPLIVDRMERKLLIGIALAACVGGLALFAVSGSSPVVIVGAVMLFGLGEMCAISVGYAYTSELFPTRARASGTSLCDALGHIGGAVAPYGVLAVLDSGQPQAVFWMLAGVTVVGGLVILGGARTSRAGLTEIAR